MMRLILRIFAIFAGASLALAQVPLQPRGAVAKPGRAIVDSKRHDTVRISVKFRDDIAVRLRGGVLANTGVKADALKPAAGILARLAAAGAKWERLHSIPEAKLGELREIGQRTSGKVMPDLNTAFILRLPKDMPAARIIDELNALEIVEIAEPMPLPAPPPAPGNYQPEQGYLNSAPAGIDATYAWTLPGGTGGDVRILDVEYAWNLTHPDLSATLSGAAPAAAAATQDNINHGTAVLGVLGSLANGIGTRGIVSDSNLFVVTSWPESGYNAAAAITNATAALRAGDVLLLEMQAFGPGPEEDDYVPIEWESTATYNAIVTAVTNGIIVVAAAGNGSQNLDDPMFNTGHAPFLAANDSGAIIVGAGGIAAGRGDRARLEFSSFGSTVDLHGWGELVVTTGYGTRYNADGANNLYAAAFGGTSSASPIVAGACAALQGHYKSTNGGAVLSPKAVREILRATGSPQLDGTWSPGGTFSQVGQLVLRSSGTATFSPADINSIIRFSTGEEGRITDYLGPTGVKVDVSRSLAPNAITVLRPATQNIGPRPNLRAALEYATGPSVWLDFASTAPTQTGTFQAPFKTIPNAVNAVPDGGRINIKTSSTPWTGSFGLGVPKAYSAHSFGGAVTIGQ